MISKIIAGLSDDSKFNVKKENIMEFKDYLEEAMNTYWSEIVVFIAPAEYDTEGNATWTANVLNGLNYCSLIMVIDFAQQI